MNDKEASGNPSRMDLEQCSCHKPPQLPFRNQEQVSTACLEDVSDINSCLPLGASYQGEIFSFPTSVRDTLSSKTVTGISGSQIARSSCDFSQGTDSTVQNNDTVWNTNDHAFSFVVSVDRGHCNNSDQSR